MFDYYLPEIIGAIVAILILPLFLFGVYKISIIHDDKLWNDGHCNVCGGALQYEQAVGHRSSTTYIYVCDECGKRIELYEAR